MRGTSHLAATSPLLYELVGSSCYPEGLEAVIGQPKELEDRHDENARILSFQLALSEHSLCRRSVRRLALCVMSSGVT